jgi:hypothetical protein
MIKGLAGSQGVIVNGGNTALPYVTMSSGAMGNPMQGMLRLYGSDMQVYDGSTWVTLPTSYATIELDSETRNLLDYVREQRKEELQLKALISGHNHPAVRIAQENLNKVMEELDRAKQQLKATVILSKEYENNETTAS